MNAILICNRVDSGLPHIKEARISNCSKCDARIWISPGSSGYAKDNPTPLCFECAAVELENDTDPIIAPPSEETLKEIKKELPPWQWPLFLEFINDKERLKKAVIKRIKETSKEDGDQKEA